MSPPDNERALDAAGLKARSATAADIASIAEIFGATIPSDPKGADVFGHLWFNRRPGWTWDHHLLVSEHRGRGIARAVKMETLAQAVGSECPLCAPTTTRPTRRMRHINEELGHHRIPGWLSFIKEV